MVLRLLGAQRRSDTIWLHSEEIPSSGTAIRQRETVFYLGARRPWTWDAPDEERPQGQQDPACPPPGRLSRAAVRLLLSLKMARSVPTLATRYPHVLNRLAELWEGVEETEAYVVELMLAQRDKRKGFDLAAIQEIAALAELHRRRMPRSGGGAAQSGDVPWRG